CVFSTKTRLPLIPPQLLSGLIRYLHGIGANIRVPVIEAGGTQNHVHITFKSNSSRWIREHGSNFAWQDGYAAFSVSASNRDAVRQYIEKQAQNHRKRSFEEEFVTLLRKSGVDFDEKYVFG